MTFFSTPNPPTALEMEFLQFLVRWLIYLVSVFIILVAVSVFTLDVQDGSTNVATCFVLVLGMVFSVVPALLHYTHPRLVYIAAMMVLSVLFLFMRLIIRWQTFRWELMWVVMLDVILGAVFIALEYLQQEDKPSSVMGMLMEEKIKTGQRRADKENGTGADKSLVDKDITVSSAMSSVLGDLSEVASKIVDHSNKATQTEPDSKSESSAPSTPVSKTAAAENPTPATVNLEMPKPKDAKPVEETPHETPKKDLSANTNPL